MYELHRQWGAAGHVDPQDITLLAEACNVQVTRYGPAGTLGIIDVQHAWPTPIEARKEMRRIAARAFPAPPGEGVPIRKVRIDFPFEDAALYADTVEFPSVEVFVSGVRGDGAWDVELRPVARGVLYRRYLRDHEGVLCLQVEARK